jgi:1-acyl-sn-glycerol-3-phosphate acyltransferase
MMGILRAIVFWIFAWTYTMLIFLSLCVAVLFLKFFARRRVPSAAHYAASVWARGFFRFIPAWSLAVEGVENLPSPQQAAILISNHQSMADIWAMYCVERDFCWLSKEEVFRLPMLGSAMRWAEYIPVRRSDRNSAAMALDTSRERLKQGRWMFFFPEGTRSHDDNLLPFRSGAFRLSDELNLPIVPITIDGAGQLMRKGSLIPNRSRVRLKISPPTYRQPAESVEDFADRVRGIVQHNLNAMRVADKRLSPS